MSKLSEGILRDYVIEVVKRCKKGDKKVGKPWCLYTKDGKRVLGHHKTPADAYAQEKAIELSELNEATYNSMREWFVEGKWYPVSRDDDHDAWAQRYYHKLGIDPEIETEEYTNHFVKYYGAIRRHGNTFLVSNMSNAVLRTLQDHIAELEMQPSTYIWVGALNDRMNVRCTVQDFIEAKSFKELDLAKGLFR